MERSEAEGKLRHYHADFGDWIYTASAADVRTRAAQASEQAETLFGEKKLSQLRQSVQLGSVADCLEVLGDDRPQPPATANVRSLDVRRVEREVIAQARVRMADEGDADLDIDFIPEELEVFNMLDLTTRAMKPRFQRGDRAWVCTYDDKGFVEGYMPVIVVGLEIYPDEVMYMWGTYDEDEGTVATCFETCSDDEIWEEMPDTLNGAVTKPAKRDRSHLSVVK